jgi:integrase
MNGVIRTREKCAHCGQSFVDGLVGRERDLVCPCGRTPRTYYIYIYWPAPGENPDRKIYEYKQIQFKDYEFTSRILTQMRNEIHDKLFDIHDYLPKSLAQFTPRKLVVKFYRAKFKKGLAPTTRHALRGHIRNYLSPGAQRLKLTDCREIRTHHVEDFYNNLPGTISLKTKENIMTNLQSFTTWLYNREILGRRPQYPVISVPRPIPRWTKQSTALQALPCVPTHDRPVIHFMLFHPLRSGEVCMLRRKDFHLDEGFIHVHKALSLGEERTRKNKKEYLCALAEKFDRGILNDKLPEARVFLNSIGNHYTSNHLKKIWRKACETAGIEYIPLKYAGRTTIATTAINNGESIEAVAGALGDSVEVTRTHYAHLGVEAMRGVIDGKK